MPRTTRRPRSSSPARANEEPSEAPPPRNRRLPGAAPRTKARDDAEAMAVATTPLASVPPPSDDEAGPGLGALWARVRGPLVALAKTAVVLAALAGAVAVGRLTRDYVRTSPAFAIETITIAGQERLEEDAVREAAGLAPGMNVFELGPEDVRARLVRHPWIAEAEVERRLPGTFAIEVREHEAVAVIALGDELYLIGRDGTVFKKVELGDPVDVPLVSGVSRQRFVGDRAYRTSLLLEVVALMHDYRAAGLWRREPIGEMHVQPTDEVTLYVGDDGMEVRLGRGPWLPKLRKLRRVLERLDETESRPEYVVLDNVRRPDRVVVRLREEPDPTPPEPEEPAAATEDAG
ncbi:MAG TPA: FtsQ-type POTRA domain-containing protein [Polyangiaceae bacterium LLY-WYZ-15_(1-7)]|nr:hypothetical protein [Myxococcales bacterium]MAT29867.1 hypothetical protein [Sandaracinus sp.]HJK93279.1 FtsQ-type POTRA domain-containing protein [Polyangiaceae bacterium LLY-WYZ-15_(1-7)]MBJ73613.1 hypothetical protein [Sandaracinus sp.]HJL01129.1 FtsQ-type POTRA domain-containing protein [Polyangiaceae bacterium LLY-WYZ-15_(1-7)]